MRFKSSLLCGCLFALSAVIASAAPATAAGDLPTWAYPMAPPAGATPPDDGAAKQIPGSAQSFTLKEIRDIYKAPDWHPDNHPPMPEVVAKGHAPKLLACGYCHLPNGLGRPETSGIASLNVDYILRQIRDFRSGARVSSEPKMYPQSEMIKMAKAATDAEIQTAAEYFSSLKLTRWIKVVESKTAPKTKMASMLLPDGSGETEPLGHRIIEVPDDATRTDFRDSESKFTAYVPVGSIKKGEKIAAKGVNGPSCTVCHGADLRGLGPVPNIAGRSPSYLVRQLYDFKSGSRAGPWSALMAPAVVNLTADDIIAIAAYAASREP